MDISSLSLQNVSNKLSKAVNTVEKFSDRLLHNIPFTVKKIAQVANILFCFFTQSSMFWVGFTIGVVNPRGLDKAINHLHRAWVNHPTRTVAITIVASIFAFAMTFLANAFFTGGYLGKEFNSLPSRVPKL